MTSGSRPSGTVTFLFTDIEASTRLWHHHPEEMRVALAAHDEVVRSTVKRHGGYVFSTGGDGFAVAFSRAAEAVRAAVEAQSALQARHWPAGAPIRVRMGVVTGEAQERDGDYFGPALNRAARVMAAGHGGQILLSAATAVLVDGVDLIDLGMHELRDLPGREHLFQIRANGLMADFPALRTVDAIPGNLRLPTTSFVGRASEVKQVAELVRAHRLVTLTGVGGVGKTRLALQVAAGLPGDFPDGVWLVELAPVGDPVTVPEVVAAALRVTPQGQRSVAGSLVEALSGRRLLIVLDNCEHVVDAAADLVEEVLAHTAAVKVIATSREGLRVGAEQLWPVPSLGASGEASEAVELFVERAQAVNPAFSLDDGADVESVVLICQRLDGIALAIELAAARTVSMGPQEVANHLGDRFRLLAGGRRGVERHQTLRHAVAWSYDLLNDDEKMLLNRCSVFAGGFDLATATHLCDAIDEYTVLDVVDSLVRKSLVTAQRTADHTRYGMYETIRQFAEEQLAATADIAEIRDRHAHYFAAQAVAYWDIWDGPSQGAALDWVDVEFANLRAAFRWAADNHDQETATAIAAHTTLLVFLLQRFEPVRWAEELLDAATAAELSQLPRLYTAASLCTLTGRPEVAVGYAQTAVALQADPRYDGFPLGATRVWEAIGHAYVGQFDRALEICADVGAQPGSGRAVGLCRLGWLMPVVGRAAEARPIADEALVVARGHGNPYYIAWALGGYGRVLAETDPRRALGLFREALGYCREHRLVYGEGFMAYNAAGLEAVYGHPDQALELFDFAIDAFHRAGDTNNLVLAVASLAVHFERVAEPGIAATLYGASRWAQSLPVIRDLPATVGRLQTTLDPVVFDALVAEGAAMELGDAVAYARHQIELARPTVAPA